MNKKELIDAIAGKADLPKATAETMLNATMEVIGDVLKSDDKIILVGFGTFSATKREARKGRNPQSGAEIEIPAKTVAKFKPGKALDDKLNS